MQDTTAFKVPPFIPCGELWPPSAEVTISLSIIDVMIHPRHDADSLLSAIVHCHTSCRLDHEHLLVGVVPMFLADGTPAQAWHELHELVGLDVGEHPWDCARLRGATITLRHVNGKFPPFDDLNEIAEPEDLFPDGVGVNHRE
jgi:hypothetical protein